MKWQWKVVVVCVVLCLALGTGYFFVRTIEEMYQISLHKDVYAAEEAIRAQAYSEGYAAGRKAVERELHTEIEYSKVLTTQALHLADEVKRTLENTLWAAQCDAAIADKLKLEGSE